MAHLKGFGVENFRVFKEHTWFDFAPITVLVGPNSSGKSSVNKALLLLKNIIVKSDFDFKIDESYLQLGGFERIISHNSDKQCITYSFNYQLNHFPTLGEKKVIKIFLDFHKQEGLTKILLNRFYLTIDNQIFLENDFNKFKFNAQIFNKFLFLDVSNYRVTNPHTKRHIIERLDFNKYTKRYTKGEKQKFGSYILNENIIGTFDQNICPTDDFFNIYSKSNELKNNFIEIPLVTEFMAEQSYQTPDGGLETYESPEIFEETEPLIASLVKSGYSRNQANYINKYIFDYKNLIQELKCFEKLKDIEYHISLKGTTKRIYRREEDDYFNNLLSSFFEVELSKNKKEFLDTWSNSFSLKGKIEPILDKKYNFQTVDVGIPLIEQGFGISQLVAILLKIMVIEAKTLILEEPEANLHPAFQSKLADMFLDACKTFNQQFIIETHSEYMVRKFQYLVAKGEMKKEDVVIYYFHDPNNIPEGEPQVKKIEILEDGSLSDDFGPGFFDEADNLAINLFNLQNRKN